MKALYDVPAPAKLNLFLHITGRRADGYHLLQSVFMLIDWQDRLHFERRADGLITREDLTMPLPQVDLTVRAAQALQARTGCGLGVHIGIHKSIPAQAGMGGGSSDAATCLLALNRLWGLNLPLNTLCQIGETLGADVPFFLRGHNAWVEGIGEHITPIDLPAAGTLVVKPPAGLSTPAIFSSPGLRRNTGTATISGFAANPFGFGHNDLQPIARTMCAEVEQVIEWMALHGLQGRMTGSGSAVFAVWPSGDEPNALREALASTPPGWLVKQCSSMEVHPLCGWATSDK